MFRNSATLLVTCVFCLVFVGLVLLGLYAHNEPNLYLNKIYNEM